jgi:ankyrin repeat protein
MDGRVKTILAWLRDSPEFSEQADFSDVNVCAIDGDNALRWVVRSGDRSGAKSLVKAGINVNKAGDLGYTPLHVACMRGDVEMVRLLVESGANLFAKSEDDTTPFESARLAGHDRICKLLRPLIKERSRNTGRA